MAVEEAANAGNAQIHGRAACGLIDATSIESGGLFGAGLLRQIVAAMALWRRFGGGSDLGPGPGLGARQDKSEPDSKRCGTTIWTSKDQHVDLR